MGIEGWEEKGGSIDNRVGIYILVMQFGKKMKINSCRMSVSLRCLQGEFKDSKVSTEEVFWEWVHIKDSSFSWVNLSKLKMSKSLSFYSQRKARGLTNKILKLRILYVHLTTAIHSSYVP